MAYLDEERYEREVDRWAGYEQFANLGGNSALRKATRSNPRIHPCPTCKQPNRLTAKDKAHGYCCDPCADRTERGGY